VVGLLVGYSSSDYASREQSAYKGAAIGALAGLVITFLSTGSLDGIPDEEPTRTSWHQQLTPMMVQVAGTDGSVHPGFGFWGSLF
jgi:hypothetical protein